MSDMTIEYAIKLLHPKTTAATIAELEYYAGFSGKKAAIHAIDDACEVACEAMALQLKMGSLLDELKKRNLTMDHIMEYIKFEDECIQKGFTFDSLIKAREKQIPKKYMDTSDAHHGKCPVCGVTVYRNSYCWKCGQAIDWK